MYSLNMKGRAKLASVKNFILENSQTGNEALLLGKIGDNIFNLDVYYPFSPFMGTAVAMSSFLYKNW